MTAMATPKDSIERTDGDGQDRPEHAVMNRAEMRAMLQDQLKRNAALYRALSK